MNKTEKFWDRIAKQWDAQGNELDQASIKMIEKTKKHLQPNDIVLDYGCGTGTITNEIAVSVREVHGGDISSGMIDVAKRTADERKIENVHYAQSTIFDERYEDESFDAITAFNILHLLEDSPEVMRRINELLKPGGLFISATPILGENKILGIFLVLLSKTGLVPYLNMLGISELEDSIASGNFEIVESEILRKSPINYFIAAKKI